ncbi:MAG: M48 family metalloprotease [Bdellovibrionales bacterium]
MKTKSVTPTQVWLFILASSLIFLILGSQLGGRLGLFICLLLSLVFHLMLFYWGEGLLLRRFHLTPLKGQDPWGLNELNIRWSQELGLTTPDLWILEESLPTAFSFEAPWKRPMVGFSRGLTQNFSKRDLEMILAHQLCHLQSRQSLKSAVGLLLANSLAILAEKIDSLWLSHLFFKRRQRPFLWLFSPLIAIFVSISQSKSDQITADLNAAHLIGQRDQLGHLLWKLEGWALTHPMSVPTATSQLFIVNPERLRQKNTLLQFHPPLQKRLEKLVGFYPI